MNSSISNLFFKQATCPSSETLLAYSASAMAASRRAGIAAHLATCDFCDAELSLLAEHSPPAQEDCPNATIPLNLRCLAEALLRGNAPSMDSISSAEYEKEGLTLTDA